MVSEPGGRVFMSPPATNQPPDWLAEVVAARSRKAAAPTFSPDGLYFLGPVYEERYGLPTRTAAYDWLP